MSKSYIYIRHQKKYEKYVKLGMSLDLIRTNLLFRQLENAKGKYIRIFEIDPRIIEEALCIIDDELYRYENLDVKNGFYYISIVQLIEDIFKRYEIPYLAFDKEKINKLNGFMEEINNLCELEYALRS